MDDEADEKSASSSSRNDNKDDEDYVNEKTELNKSTIESIIEE